MAVWKVEIVLEGFWRWILWSAAISGRHQFLKTRTQSQSQNEERTNEERMRNGLERRPPNLAAPNIELDLAFAVINCVGFKFCPKRWSLCRSANGSAINSASRADGYQSWANNSLFALERATLTWRQTNGRIFSISRLHFSLSLCYNRAIACSLSLSLWFVCARTGQLHCLQCLPMFTSPV